MGLYQIWKLDTDPTDPVSPYTPYTFDNKVPSVDFGITRRESVMVIPGMDGVLDGYGLRRDAPLDKRMITYGFRVLTRKGVEAAHDLLMAAMLGGQSVRLVRKNDAGALLFTTAKLVSTQEVRTYDADFYFDFKVTWRIRPDWRPRFSESVESFASTTVFAAATTFGGRGTTLITTDPQNFTVDATGTAGQDLPTLPDSGPTVIVTGPCGGLVGFSVANTSYLLRDSTGSVQVCYFVIPFKLPTSSDTVSLKFSSQTFLHNGVPFRPLAPVDAKGLSYQGEWWRIVPGIVNHCALASLGGSTVTGGSIKVDWWRKIA